MSQDEQYEELSLYLSEAENEISQAFNAGNTVGSIYKHNGNEELQLENEKTPKSVHFADTCEEILIEPNLYLSPYERNQASIGFASKEGDSLLKSCLKNSARLRQYEFLSSSQQDEYLNRLQYDYFDRNQQHEYPNRIQRYDFLNLNLHYEFPIRNQQYENLSTDRGLETAYGPFTMTERYPRSDPQTVYPFLPAYGHYVPYPQPLTERTHLIPQTIDPMDTYLRPPETYTFTHQQNNPLPPKEQKCRKDINSETDESILNLIESIKADIQELKEKYEHDDEIERNRFLTQELEDILNLYKSNILAEKETDAISDKTSSSNYHSGSLETVINNTGTQTSPTTSLCSTNLSKDSECSSSPCLTSNSDNDLADDDRSLSSSSDSRYHTPPDWVPVVTPKAVLRSKSSSAPVLKNQQPKVNKHSRSQSDRHLADKTHFSEIEAAEACRWLRATGFPQYAQMYDDMLFPVDLCIAVRDHPLLEQDVLNSLYRRLRTLNNCCNLTQQRVARTDESEDENFALSQNWTFQSDIRRWSRACTDPVSDSEVLQTAQQSSESDQAQEVPDRVPRDNARRGGSVNFRRRREGVVISDSGAKLLDSLSEQLSGISVGPSASHVSDSELTPTFYGRSRNKPAEVPARLKKTVTRAITSTVSCEDGFPYFRYSSPQLANFERFAMLKLTAIIEEHCPTHRTGFSWILPKSLIRKMRNPAYKDKSVFGVPIQITLQRTGLTLPKHIELALEWLQENAADHVGLFRKSGVKSRIQALRDVVETTKDPISYQDQQPYDIADMVKQYFRELPEALLTSKYSETFKLIFQYVPLAERMDAVICGIFLLPDEHIEVLQTLILFLSKIAKRSDVNQMNESNLATCFAPSLFQYSPSSKGNLGTPHPKDLAENKAAHDCLQFFLENHEKIFKIPENLKNQLEPGKMKEWKVLTLDEIGKEIGGWKAYLYECEHAHLKEVKSKSRGWETLANFQNQKVEVCHKVIDDGLSVRVWKVITDIDAPPAEVMHRILRERPCWDPELQSAKIIKQLDTNSEIFQYGRKRLSCLPIEEYCVVRQWRSDLARGACLVVETSVEHSDIVHIPESIRGIVHASRYFIEPCGSGRSRLYHICRIDTMGRKPDYYHRDFGHIVGLLISNLQSSFQQRTDGPESNV